ncbi:Protein of unknown function [Tistlia consotensis]|uniref:DUF2975 domain-containing protein n=1 Tax=Tistlia consotensis USBA 355 TaxID=560819 RepID=A0A1Y6C463_9PROT|nr:DUF2975 domain-containing protein [Tistlia consotensis]SMF33023.1 Protein of unknown function [Tistlia consotensis USBA 355]SNR69187.1 Protein of unknown function [Tistlia consotensis]
MSDLAAIRRMGRAMALACLAAMIALPLLLTGAWLALPELKRTWPPFAILPIPAEPEPGLMVAGWLVLLLPLVVLLWGVHRLRRLFLHYAQGEVFSVDAALCLSGFARAVLVWALLQPLANGAAGAILTLGNPPGQRALALSLGTGELGALAIGLVLLVIGRVMREASRLADENASFV